MRLLRVLALSTLFVLAGCREWDLNHDGAVVVACLGDSNSFHVDDPADTSGLVWCQYLERELHAAGCPATVKVFAMFSSTATPNDWTLFGASLSAETYVHTAIASTPKPDLAIMAWGTNDAFRRLDTAGTVAALRRYADDLRAAGIRPMIALVPPIAAPAETTSPGSNAAAGAISAGLRAAVAAAELVDFETIPDSDFDADPPTDESPRITTRDGAHINATGQRRRGHVAAQAWIDRP